MNPKSAFSRLALAVPFVLAAVPCWADVSAKDVQVIGRALGFVENPPSGTAELGIVYSAASAASQKEADALKALLGDGVTAGKLLLKPKLIPVDQVGSASGVAALYVTSGLGADAAKAAEAGKRLHVPTLSTDIACAQSGNCVMGLKSEPSVEIVVNKAAAASSGIGFSAAFRMLIKEI